MNPPDPVSAAESPRALAELNRWLARLDARDRIRWALTTLSGPHALSSSFGAQSAVALHLATGEHPELPVILIDTGYLFPETHAFVESLRDRLSLNLKVYRPRPEEAWDTAAVESMQSLGVSSIARYNRIHKVEPMQRALRELDVRCWFAGLRREQSSSRADIGILELHDGRWKLHPLADWNNRDVHRYLLAHELPYHPLWQKGYVSIGDTHSTRPLEPGLTEDQTRFFGLKRECGLHESWDEPVVRSC